MGLSSNKAPLWVGLISALVMAGLVIGLTMAHDGHVSALMMLPEKGECYQQLGAPSGVAVFPEAGYDGNLFYYIARDLAMEHGCTGAYRYQRILYPVMIWAFSLGQEAAMPLMMSVINLLAIGLGAWLMAVWLSEMGESPWLGLLYGLSLGHVLIVQYALSGAVALTFCLAGAFLVVRRERPWAAMVMFALALLTRETVVLMWGPMILWLFWERKFKAAIILGLAIVPYLGWEGVLWWRFGSLPLTGTNAEAVQLNLEGQRYFWSHLVLDQGFREFLRSSSSFPYLLFVFFWLGLSAWALKNGRGMWAFVLGCHALVALFFGRGMWAFISSVGRITITAVPVLLLLAADLGPKPRKLIHASLAGLFVLGLARVYLAGVHEYFIQG